MKKPVRKSATKKKVVKKPVRKSATKKKQMKKSVRKYQRGSGTDGGTRRRTGGAARAQASVSGIRVGRARHIDDEQEAYQKINDDLFNEATYIRKVRLRSNKI